MIPKYIYISHEDAKYLNDNTTGGITAHTDKPMLSLDSQIRYTNLELVWHDVSEADFIPSIHPDDLCICRDTTFAMHELPFSELLKHREEYINFALRRELLPL